MAAKVIVRDKLGRFMKLSDRYKPAVAMIQVQRKKQYITLAERPLPPEDLANVLSQREFESLPEALVSRGFYKSTSKYKAWDIAEQIDQSKKMRRKQLKFTVVLKDGKQQRQITFYHQIKRNQASSYALFRRINQEIGFEGYYLYNQTTGGKILADRKGKKVHLVGIQVEEVV